MNYTPSHQHLGFEPLTMLAIGSAAASLIGPLYNRYRAGKRLSESEKALIAAKARAAEVEKVRQQALEALKRKEAREQQTRGVSGYLGKHNTATVATASIVGLGLLLAALS